MGWLDLSMALLAAGAPLPPGILAAAEPPELVTVPMATDGARASEAMEAWKIVHEAIRDSAGQLGVSVKLQARRHDFVVGPAREQAKDCDGNLDCLQAIGGALGADVLVTGRVTADAVALVAVEVATGRLIGQGSTPPELGQAPLESRASAAARLLVASLGGGPPEPEIPRGGGPVALVPGGGPAPVGGGGDDDLKGFDDAPASAPPPSPSPSAAAMQGNLQISAAQLRGVRRVAIDGAEISFRGDGSVAWAGAPGDHRLVVERASGERLARNVFLEPGSTTNVVLEWPNVTRAPAAAAPAARDDGGSVLTKWWFWTSLGAAVAAGTTTAVLLAGGDKGGPTLPNETGRIQGSY